MVKRARARGREESGTVKFWFRRKYNLPPNSPLFLSLTDEEVLTDFFAHYYADNPNAEQESVDDDFDMDAELALADAEAEGLPDDFEDV
mgnify:FL=1